MIDKSLWCREERDRQAKLSKTQPSSSYYVYLHRRATDDSVFYVGKGKRYRAWETVGRSSRWYHTVSKYNYYVEIVFDQLEDTEAYELEATTFLEMDYHYGNLVNLVACGRGTTSPSEETREKMSLAKRGKTPHNKGKRQLSTVNENNPSADNGVYYFCHTSGETFKGTRYALAREYQLKLSALGKLFYKSDPRNRIFGWSVVEKIND